MKVAISTEGENVSPHFGRCPFFTILEIDNGKVVKREKIPNPGHQPGFLPEFLKEKGVECIICGGMGPRAQNLFTQKEINVILGVEEKIDTVVEKLLKGKLRGGESLCRPGQGRGYGIPKEGCSHK